MSRRRSRSAPIFVLQAVVIRLIELGRRNCPLRFAGLSLQFVDGGADLLDFGVAEFDRVDDRLFFYFFGAGLDHHDAFGGADHHDVQQAVAHLGVGRIDDELAIDQADANRADRAEERNVGNGQSAQMRR